MPTVIDALIVTLGLDPTQFTEGQKKTVDSLRKTGVEAERTTTIINRGQKSTGENLRRTESEAARAGKNIEHSGANAAEFFGQMRNQALALFAVFTGGRGLKEFAVTTTNVAAATGRLAHNLGISTQELSSWQIAVKQFAGGSAEGVAASFSNLKQALAGGAMLGGSPLVQYFRTLGVHLTDAHNVARPLNQILLDIAGSKKFQSMAPADQVWFGHAMGLDDNMINFVQQGRPAVEAALKKARAEGTVTPDQAAALQKLQTAFIGVQTAAEALERVMLTKLAPALTKILDEINDFIVKNPGAAGAVGVGAGVAGSVAIGAVLKRLFFGGGGKVAAGAAAAGGGSGLLRLLSLLFPAAVVGTTMSLSGDTDPNAAAAGAPSWAKPGGFFGRGGIFEHWFGGGASTIHTADTTMSPTKRAFLDSLSMGESKGYNEGNPRDNQGRVLSTAHGRYQFLDSTDRQVSTETGLPGQDPVSQDRKGWYYAAKVYRQNTGRDLETDSKDPARWEGIAYALNKVWPSLPGGSQQNTTMQQWKRHMADNNAAYGPQMRATHTPAGDFSSVDTILNGIRASRGGDVTNNAGAHTETHIGEINVHTKATDAKGIAAGIGGALRSNPLVRQANTGLAY
jgi:hypothetical protein